MTRRAYRLVRPPEMRFSPANIRIHGIRPRDVAREPDLPTVLEPFMADLVGSTVLAHNAGFDIAVLCGTLAAYGRPAPRLSYLCTKAIARRAWPNEPRFGLAAMAAMIGVTFRHHHAEEDAYACARLALAAAERAGTRRISILADRLGIRSKVVEWPADASCGSARLGHDRRREIRVPRAPSVAPAGRLAFSVRGSKGDLYDVVGSLQGSGYALRCSCTAGRHRLRCRHVTALLDGEITDLTSDNHYDVEKLRTVVQAVGEGAISPR